MHHQQWLVIHMGVIFLIWREGRSKGVLAWAQLLNNANLGKVTENGHADTMRMIFFFDIFFFKMCLYAFSNLKKFTLFFVIIIFFLPQCVYVLPYIPHLVLSDSFSSCRHYTHFHGRWKGTWEKFPEVCLHPISYIIWSIQGRLGKWVSL